MELNLKYIYSRCVNEGLMLKYFLGGLYYECFLDSKKIVLGHHEAVKLL